MGAGEDRVDSDIDVLRPSPYQFRSSSAHLALQSLCSLNFVHIVRIVRQTLHFILCNRFYVLLLHSICNSVRTTSLIKRLLIFILSYQKIRRISVSPLIDLLTLTFDLSTSKRSRCSFALWSSFLPTLQLARPSIQEMKGSRNECSDDFWSLYLCLLELSFRSRRSFALGTPFGG